jgi:hypothetical protein
LTAPFVDANLSVIISSLFEVVNTQQAGDAGAARSRKRGPRKQAEILTPMLVQTRAVAKKVVDKKPGGMLGSFESRSSTLLFYLIGAGIPKYACPSRKGEGN